MFLIWITLTFLFSLVSKFRLAPDVACLGNHELDYGIAHLLFLEKCASFPIVNANIYIKTTGTRLFNSHTILEVGGMKILFIGLLTEEIMAGAKSDMLLGTFIGVEDAAKEVGRIINSYKTTQVLHGAQCRISSATRIRCHPPSRPYWSRQGGNLLGTYHHAKGSGILR